MIDIVVVGGGGHAKVVIAVLLESAGFRVAGYTDPADGNGPILGVERLGRDDALGRFARDHPGGAAAIGIGMVGSTAVRRRLEAMLAGQLALALPVIRGRSAQVHASVYVGYGTFIAEGVVVNPSVRIGRCVILNTGAIVEHDVVIGDHSHVAPGAILCGGATIGEDCWIGAGAVIAQMVSVPSGCVVGAGAVVPSDLPASGTYVGVPAKKIQ
jgi:UDP-perosamine 4-acetyltransferase